MNSLRLKLDDWKERRKRKFIRRWGRMRAKGHPVYILGQVILWGLAATFVFSLGEYIDRGQIETGKILFKSLSYMIIGLIVAVITYEINEKEYLKYMKESDAEPPLLSAADQQSVINPQPVENDGKQKVPVKR